MPRNSKKKSLCRNQVNDSGRNIKLEIEYDGTNYYGWQIQNNPSLLGGRKTAGRRRSEKNTIQKTLEKTLQKILREKVRLIVSGRTDAGVHAQIQVANFKTHSSIDLNKLHAGLDALLPEDISISAINEAKDDFHSRFDAKSKTYRYTILNNLHPRALLRNTAYFCRYPLDVGLMRREARCLLGRHNFKAFCASAGAKRNPIKTIKKIKITKVKDIIYMDIEADGFLYNMARNITGTLIEIGRGRFPKKSLKRILLSKNRRLAGPTAPAKGLMLTKIKYD